MGGAKSPAHDVLDIAAQAFETLDSEQGLAQVTSLRETIGDRDEPDT
ncbi:MAG: hypothetical protein GY717_06975 [Rhodobacteraceae bacterium]|nr:hypothetical protein [Paracoccaceae bacterium]